MPYPLLRRSNCGRILIFIVFVSCCINLHAQAKWDGDAGDGQWTTAANWTGDQLPLLTDYVVLDNSIVPGNYTITLPGSAIAISVRSVSITPLPRQNIQLVLPASSTATPAFTTTGPGYGVILNSGATLLNASATTSGASLVVNDSIRINNGGQYVHNTRSAHAALVNVLSRQAGTEKGIFKFDPPGGGYTLATTGRTYGTLILSAVAAGGNIAYSSSAASPLNINGDFIIEPGVTVNLDITAATTINGNYLQQGGVFNLASQPNNNTVYIKGDFIQQAGTITETSSGLPTIELNGSNNQNIKMMGTVTNNVSVNINNNAGVTLNSSLLLPYQLKLVNGVVTTQSFMVTLLAGCHIIADSSSNNSFINGKLRKEGLSGAPYFLFPVGKGNTQRWLELKNATGNFTVEFFKADPHSLSSIVSTGIHHISSIEYWSVQADAAPAPLASVEPSFDNVNSGGVTELSTLRVAQIFAGVWKDKGNIATSGSAGSAGSVTSQPVNIFSAPDIYFALAGSEAFQNPLPLQLISFAAHLDNHTVELTWERASSLHDGFFELQTSTDGIHFTKLTVIDISSSQVVYSYADNKPLFKKRYYRLKCVDKTNLIFYSRVIKMVAGENDAEYLKVFTDVSGSLNMMIHSAGDTNGRLSIYTNDGRLLAVKNIFFHEGSNNFSLPMEHAAAGVYIATVALNNKLFTCRFVR